MPGSKGKLKKKVDVSMVELVRKDDGKVVSARVNERRVPVEKQVSLSFRRGAEKNFTVKAGDEISLFARKYRILSLGEDAKNPEVRVMDILTKSEVSVTPNGKKRQ